MSSLDFVGFDVHKKTISFCVKACDGQILVACRDEFVSMRSPDGEHRSTSIGMGERSSNKPEHSE